MTALDDKLVPKVLALIAKYGMAVTLRTPSGGTFDPTTNTASGDTPVTTPTKCTPFSPHREAIDGQYLTINGEYECYVAALNLGVVPIPGMEVVRGSTVKRIKQVEEVYTGEEVAAYRLILEK